MILAQSRMEIAKYTCRQISALFPAGKSVSPKELGRDVVSALDRLEFCFRRIAHPAYCNDGEARFSVLNSDQYCHFLYFLSNTVHARGGPESLCQRLFCLNKALHGFNCMYDTQLPSVFWIIHAVGTVLGKAIYGSHLVVRQNCTVGALGGHYPVIGDRVVLSAGASIIGHCDIGRNVMIGPGCCVLNQNVPPNSLVSTALRLRRRPNSPRAFSIHFREE